MFNFEIIKSLTFIEQKEYIRKHFIPLNNGNHVVLGDNDTYEIFDQATIKKVYFNRLNTDINKYYFTEYTELRNIVCILNKPQIFENKFNICPAIKSIYKPYEEHNENDKIGVQIFLNYIKEVLASDNEECYIYLLKWIANMLKGNKNDSCIYFKGAQGIGKSTLSDFLKDHVIGQGLFLETGSSPLKGQFNSILQGKLLVQFSELENFGVHDWSGISSKLKRNISSNTYTVEAKGKDSIQINNINNYILDSNNDAIKDDEGRRYFIADVSHKYQGDKNGFFTNLHDKSFSDSVGSAFYAYMIEYNTDGFQPQKYPITKSKLNSISKRLDTVYQFLKDEYVLKNTALFIKPKDLFLDYSQYGINKQLPKIHDLIEFRTKLEQVGITCVIASKARTNYYKVSIEDLKKIADEKKWIHENDLEDFDTFDDKPEMITVPQEDYQQLLNRIKELEEKLSKFTPPAENIIKKEENLIKVDENITKEEVIEIRPKKKVMKKITKKIVIPKEIEKADEYSDDDNSDDEFDIQFINKANALLN
jgi:hypothetical protein